MGISEMTDASLQGFVRDGYVLADAGSADPLHAVICERLQALYDAEGNPGNNLLPSVPELADVFSHEAVVSALTRILGPGYRMHGHRHGHRTVPGTPGMAWHKDSTVFDPTVRHPRPRFVLALYYPQAVTLDMGPTGVISRLQYVPTLSDADQSRTVEPGQTPLCVPAGTVAIVHNDAWHCAMANAGDKPRFMLKFLFERLEEPQQSGADGIPDWEPDPNDPFDVVHADVWRWLHGRSASISEESCSEERIRAWEGALDDPDRSVSLGAAYRLAERGAQTASLLAAALVRQSLGAEPTMGAKSPGDPHGINPHALPAACGLAAAGEPAIDALVPLLAHENWCVRMMAVDTLGNIGPIAGRISRAIVPLCGDGNARVRRHAVEALGRLGVSDRESVGAMVACLADSGVAVRHNACLALAKVAVGDESVVDGLAVCLRDDDRYVRDVASTALRRIGSPRASSVLFDFLTTSRWCDLTTRRRPF